jgi:ClpP class serine protease
MKGIVDPVIVVQKEEPMTGALARHPEEEIQVADLAKLEDKIDGVRDDLVKVVHEGNETLHTRINDVIKTANTSAIETAKLVAVLSEHVRSDEQAWQAARLDHDQQVRLQTNFENHQREFEKERAASRWLYRWLLGLSIGLAGELILLLLKMTVLKS